jgi:DNA-binding IclR family transcriptional regulator
VVPSSSPSPPEGKWTFVTSHLIVLLCLAEDPTIRMVEVAERAGITHRAVQGIVADLVKAGYVNRTRVGRRNQYQINPELPLRHLEIQHHRLGELLTALSPQSRET